MPLLRFSVAVVIERVPLANRWVSEQWRVAAIEVDASPPAPPRKQSDDATGTRWRFSGQFIELHRSESEGYYLNITSPEAKVFVMWRMAETDSAGDGEPKARPHLVTVSYNEAARLLDGGEQVDAAPLPAEVRAWMEPFVAEHYRPEPKRKVRRNDLYERDGRGRGQERKDGR
jgi:hypothetical protein